MSRTSRLRAGLRARVAGAVGTRELVDVEASVASLEVAVGENRALEVALERQVEHLELTVADVLSRRNSEGMGA